MAETPVPNTRSAPPRMHRVRGQLTHILGHDTLLSPKRSSPCPALTGASGGAYRLAVLQILARRSFVDLSQETELEVSLFSTIRSVDRPTFPLDRTAEVPRPSLAKEIEEPFSLPRHLLVSLAGITADVTSLQERCVDTPDLHVALGRMLDRLDGLVDSIYGRAQDLE